MFARHPAVVDQDLLDVLRDGFARRFRMSLHWVEDASGEAPTVSEIVVERDGWLHIHLRAERPPVHLIGYSGGRRAQSI